MIEGHFDCYCKELLDFIKCFNLVWDDPMYSVLILKQQTLTLLSFLRIEAALFTAVTLILPCQSTQLKSFFFFFLPTQLKRS